MPIRAICVTLALTCLGSCRTTEPATEQLPPELAAYRRSFEKAAGKPTATQLEQTQLIANARQGRVLWLGDTHGSGRLHALQTELLAALQRSGVKLALLLESVGTQDGAAVQEFLTGEIDILQLRKLTQQRWPGCWLSDPELDPFFYQGLLLFARRYELPVVPLEPTPRAPLAERDAAIASVIQAAAAAHPDRLLVVVVGQAHLLGTGDLIARTGLPGLAIGGEPPAVMRSERRERDIDLRRGLFLRSSGGLWWFAELCRKAD